MDAAELWLRENDPSYHESRRKWKQLTRMTPKGDLDYGSPVEDIALSPIDDIDDGTGESCSSELETAILTHGLDYDRWFEPKVEYDKKPHRKRDRHKGSRAAYMRQYRKRRKAA